MANRVVLPLHILLSGDASQLRREIGQIVSTSTTGLAARAREATTAPQLAGVRQSLGYQQGTALGQIQRYQQAGILPANIAEMSRGIVRQVYQQTIAGMQREAAGLRLPSEAQIGRGLGAGERIAAEQTRRMAEIAYQSATNASAAGGRFPGAGAITGRGPLDWADEYMRRHPANARDSTGRGESLADRAARLRAVTDEAVVRASRERAQADAQAAAATRSFAAGANAAAVSSRAPTAYQRIQAWAHTRQTGEQANPLGFQTGGRALVSKGITTAQYGLAGGLLYGGLQLGGDILRQSTELQQELAVIRTQFEGLGDTVNGISFDGFRQQIQDTAVATGVEANRVANVQRQLAGAFADDQGRPDFERAATEGRVALLYSQMSGLPQQEITDTFTAVALAFPDESGDPKRFKEIIDYITDLENRFGVLSPEIVKFTGDLAPLAAELGLTAEQLSGLGAVAQKATAKPGVVLAEQLGRILPTMRQEASKVADIFANNDATSGASSDLLIAFAGGEVDEALRIMAQNYQKLSKGQKNEIGKLLGGRREAATLFGVLKYSDQLEAVLGDDPADSEGSFDKRVKEYQKTVQYAVSQLRRSVEEFGQLLFEMFGADLLKGGADVMRIAAGAALKLAEAIRFVNEALGGVPVRALGAYAAMATLTKILGAVGGRTGITALLGLGAVGGITAPGGLLSPYAGLPAGVAGPLAMRPSVQAAANSAFLSRFMTRDAYGAVKGGLGTFGASAVAGAAGLAPLAAIGFGAYTLSRGIETRNELKAYEGDIRARIGADVGRGVDTQALVEKYVDTAADRLDGSRIMGLFPERGWQRIWGESEDDIAARIAAEEEARVRNPRMVELLNTVRDNAPADLGDVNSSLALGGSVRFNGRFINPGTEDYSNLLADTGNYFDRTSIERQVRQEGSDELVTLPNEFAFDKEGLDRLIADLEEDPTNQRLQAVAALIANNADMHGGELSQKLLEVAAAYDEEVAGREQGNQAMLDAATNLDAEGDVRPAFEALLASSTAAYEQGRAGIDPILGAFRDRIETLQTNREDLLAAFEATGDASFQDSANMVDAELAQVIKAQQDFITNDIKNVRQLQNSILDLSNLSAGDKARQQAASARRAYDVAATTPGITPAAQANAALDYITAQRAALTSEVNAAGSQAEIDAILSSDANVIPEAARNTIIDIQLSSGLNSEIIGQISENMGIATEDVRERLVDFIKGNTEWLDSMRSTAEALEAAGLDASNWRETIELMEAIQALDPGSTIGVDKGATSALEQARLQGQKIQYRNDPVKRAEIDVQIAQNALDNLDTGDEDYDLKRQQAQNQLDQAEADYDDAITKRASNLRQLAFDLDRARAAGDPVAQANIDMRAARAKLADATTDEERGQAQVEIQNAANSQRDAEIEVLRARSSYLSAIASGDTVEQARIELEAAEDALGRARGQAERYEALQRIYEAQQSLRDGLLDVFIAQKDLAIAVAEGAGKTVEVALLQLQQAQERLRSAQANGVKGAQLDRLRADVVRAQSNVTTVTRNDRLGDLAYMYEFDRITANTYIRLLEAELAKIPESNKEARREIERRIKSLRDEMSSNLEFNIPDGINLPLPYEARRLGEVSATSYGSSYQDNRVINIEVNEARDGAAALDTVVKAIESAPRSAGSSASFGLPV